MLRWSAALLGRLFLFLTATSQGVGSLALGSALLELIHQARLTASPTAAPTMAALIRSVAAVSDPPTARTRIALIGTRHHARCVAVIGAVADSRSADRVGVLRFPRTPGSRWSIRAERRPWRERSVQMITGERRGYGRSTRLPGRGFAEHADDMARLLDHLDLDRVYVCRQSGGAPHTLAFAARHPGRLRAASILSGMAPLTDE